MFVHCVVGVLWERIHILTLKCYLVFTAIHRKKIGISEDIAMNAWHVKRLQEIISYFSVVVVIAFLVRIFFG